MERLPPGDTPQQLVPSSGGVDVDFASNYGTLQGAAGGGHEGGGAGVAIGRVISAIWRYRWLVLAIVILGTGGSIAATRFLHPLYQARGTIYIEPGNGGGKSGPIRPEELLSTSDSWIQLLRSYSVIDPVVRRTRSYLQFLPADSLAFAGFDLDTRSRFGKFRLVVGPGGRRYSLLSSDGFVVDSGAVGDSIGRKLGFLWAPALSALGKGRQIDFVVQAPRQAADELLKNLANRAPGLPGKEQPFMIVSLTGEKADQTAMTLNAVLNQFIAVAEQLKKEKLVRIATDLETQLHTADSTMRAAETALQSYRTTTITEPREDMFPLPSGLVQTQPTVMSNYFQKRLQLDALQRDRKAVEEVLRRAKQDGSISVDAFNTIDAVRQAPGLSGVLGEVAKLDAEIRALRLRYTDEYKGVKDLLAQMDQLKTVTVPLYAQRLVDQLKLQEQDLQRSIDAESKELRLIPVRSLTEEKLRREADAAATLSSNLQQRLTDARLAALSAIPDVRVLDSAVPPSKPTTNTAPRIILMGTAGSIAFALVLAFLLDRLDKRFRYPEQATHDLGLTILGAVPAIRRSGGNGVMPPAEAAQIVEAFRSIRLNLTHSFRPDEPIVLTVTSPSPGDGKSLIAANLAISFADAGYETLLIDGDTRRGEQYRTFNVERRPGLLDYIDTGIGIDDVLRPTAHERLTVVTSGSRMSRGPELLGSSRMNDLIATLRRRFQVVLMDSPPLGAGVDAFILATLSGAVVVVLRAGETDRQLAEAKLELMQRLPTRLVGAILNQIDVGHGSYKYYAYEYTTSEEGLLEEPAQEPPARLASEPR